MGFLGWSAFSTEASPKTCVRVGSFAILDNGGCPGRAADDVRSSEPEQ